MPECEKTVISIFTVQRVVGPVAVKSSSGIPKRIHKVETGLFEMGKIRLHGVQRVQSNGGGEQIGQGGRRQREEASLWQALFH